MQEPDREEFMDIVKSAYHGTKMDEKDREQIKERLLRKNQERGRRRISYKAMAAVAAFLVFVAANAVIIGLNLKHGNVVENPADDNSENTVKNQEKQDDLANVREGDVIYSMRVNSYVFESYGEGYSYRSKKYTAQVVFAKMEVTDSKSQNDKLNNDSRITGSFLIQIVDENGNVISSCPLSTGATSEYGVSLNLDEESLGEYFFYAKETYANDDMVIFRYPVEEKNGRKCYLTSFYGVDVNGNIFLYEVDDNIPQEVRSGSNFELITGENFSQVVNEPGLWQDYLVLDDKNQYIFYNFDVDEQKIKLYQYYEGTNSGEDVDAALLALQIKYDILHFSGRIPLESEEIVETVIKGTVQEAESGYQQVNRNIAGSEEEFLDYIENSVVSLESYGYKNREELRQKLFVEPIDLSHVDRTRLLMDNVTHFKMIDGKLCFMYFYGGVPWSVGNKYVAQKVDEKTTDFYCRLNGVAGIGIARVRMVLEEDGVWRAEEFEEIVPKTQRAKKDLSFDETLVKMYVEGWAKKFCERDGEAIAEICSKEMIGSLMKENLLSVAGNGYELGQSSPWPWNPETDYRILDYNESHASILYYAQTSEPHVTVWRQEITYSVENGKFIVKGQSIDYLDNIVTQEEFYAAYPEGIINETGMDYLKTGLSDDLIRNAESNRNSEPYCYLYDPESSARYLLNILNNENKVTVSSWANGNEGIVHVTFSFHEMGGMVTVTMKQMEEDGIWLPQTAEGYAQKDHAIKEKILYKVQADVDHDGIKDYIVTSTQIHSDKDEDRTLEELLNASVLLYVRIYKGREHHEVGEEKFYEMDCIWQKEFAAARPGNGQIMLVEKDGKNYILTSSINEQQGFGDYSYQVFSLAQPSEYLDEYSVSFTFSGSGVSSHMSYKERGEVVPEFRKKIENWFDKAVLIVSIDINEDSQYYISTYEKVLAPKDYYDNVWKRMD